MGIFDKNKKNEPKEEMADRLEATSEFPEKAQGFVGKLKDSAAKNRELMKPVMSGEYPDVSRERLFSAVLIAGADLKYGIDSIDKNSFSVTFQTYKNEKFWDGRLSCFVISYGDGSRVSVTGTADRGVTTSGKGSGNPFTALTQMASEGGALQCESKLKFAIAKQVPLTAEPPISEIPVAVKSSDGDLSSQLKQLKQLFDSGALTPEEFEKAKAKLLN